MFVPARPVSFSEPTATVSEHDLARLFTRPSTGGVGGGVSVVVDGGGVLPVVVVGGGTASGGRVSVRWS